MIRHNAINATSKNVAADERLRPAVAEPLLLGIAKASLSTLIRVGRREFDFHDALARAIDDGISSAEPRIDSMAATRSLWA